MIKAYEYEQATPEALAMPEAPNTIWSMDFMVDQLGDDRSFRTLNTLNDFNREGLAIDLIYVQPGSLQQRA